MIDSESIIPTKITLHKISRTLEILFDNGECFILSCEYLRVFSPSAEVQGHGNPILVTGKQQVNILSIEPVGNYAVKLIFSDGHRTGIYSWKTLRELGINQEKNWQEYQEKLTWIKKT